MRRNVLFRVDADHDGERLDRFLRSGFPELPAKSVRFAIEAGLAFVCGARSKKGRLLREGEEVGVRWIAEREDWLPLPADLPGASVLYFDDAVAVLDKPSDVHTEPHRPREEGTLAGYLLRKFPQVAGFSDDPGLTLLTRLDYAVSGAVPAALSADAFLFLAREREQGRIIKTYIGLVEGRIEEELSLNYSMETEGGEKVRVRTDREEKDPRYRTSVTPIRLVGERTLVRAVIAKGKRHQVRAHLAAAGHPIVGDRRYSAVPPEGPGKERLMLHAVEVCFAHPVRGEKLRLSSPVPAIFGLT
jgi:23S rRNA-/tRNA-specific pseudouridylate synthase